jgi:hypothetical protein
MAPAVHHFVFYETADYPENKGYAYQPKAGEGEKV